MHDFAEEIYFRFRNEQFVMLMKSIDPTSRYVRLGVWVAVLWVVAAMPDIVQTSFGNRADNSISFSPSWLKAIRDLVTLAVFISVSNESVRSFYIFRIVALFVAALYSVTAIARGISIDIAIRGVDWIPVLVWSATMSEDRVEDSKELIRGLFKILIPASLLVSLFLGFFGTGMYFESVLGYQRNPGLFLTPSATAFVSCLSFIFFRTAGTKLKALALISGALTLSGVFYINAMMLFGKLPRYFYWIITVLAVFIFGFFGLENVIKIIASIAGGVRSDTAISLTLLTRFDIIFEAISKFMFFGNYPVGLNVAANQNLDSFYPDNAVLAAVYAFGVIGILGVCWIVWMSRNNKVVGGTILLLIASFFYVWFENMLFAGLVGFLINRNYISLDEKK